MPSANGQFADLGQPFWPVPMILVPPQPSHSSDPNPSPPSPSLLPYTLLSRLYLTLDSCYFSNPRQPTRCTLSMVAESSVSLPFSNRELPLPLAPLLVVDSAGSSTTPPPPPPPRQPVVRHLSAPAESLHSPLRHHRRTASVGRPPVRETLNASLSYEEDEDGIRVNQYNPLPQALSCSSPF